MLETDDEGRDVDCKDDTLVIDLRDDVSDLVELESNALEAPEGIKQSVSATAIACCIAPIV